MTRHRRGRRGRRKQGSWFSRLTKGKKIGVIFGSIVLGLMAIGVIYIAVKIGKLNTEDIATEDIIVNEAAGAAGEGYTTVALFGIDSRSGELEKGTRSDCIIIASLNNETKEVRMASVYRDTILDIEDGYLQKCNAAYSFGGPTQAINMLNKNLDLNIQDYATVDFAAIAQAIDMLGGIEIDVKPEEIKPLNKYVAETARVAGKTANKVTNSGLQLLDGVQATTYARIRSTAGGDFTRTERQRLVIEKIVEKAQTTDLVTINNIIDEILPTIKTSFSASEILLYAKDFAKYEIGESSGFPFDKTTDTISGLGSIVIPVTLVSNVQELHKFLYDTENYTPSSEVQTINDAIISRVGQREAVDDSTLNNQTYIPTEEDRAQENNQYAPPGNNNTSANQGGNSSAGTDINNSGGNTDTNTGAGNGETETPDTGGGTETPDTGGETETPDSGGGAGTPDTGGGTETPDSGGGAESSPDKAENVESTE